MILAISAILLYNFYPFVTAFQKKDKISPVHQELIAKISGFYLTNDGFIFKSKEEKSLPTIEVITAPLRGGEKVAGDDFKIIIELLNLVKNYKLEVEKITVYNKERMDIQLTSGPVVLISAKVSIPNFISSLQVILERFKIEGKVPLYIDMRFDKPVIKF